MLRILILVLNFFPEWGILALTFALFDENFPTTRRISDKKIFKESIG